MLIPAVWALKKGKLDGIRIAVKSEEPVNRVMRNRFLARMLTSFDQIDRLAGNFNLNALNLKDLTGGALNSGLLELHLVKDGMSMNIGTGGVDASLGTVTNALVSIYETVTDRKDIAETLRTQYGNGDSKQKLQLFGIATGLVKLNLGGCCASRLKS
jgi:hypothetical protein